MLISPEDIAPLQKALLKQGRYRIASFSRGALMGQ